MLLLPPVVPRGRDEQKKMKREMGRERNEEKKYIRTTLKKRMGGRNMCQIVDK